MSNIIIDTSYYPVLDGRFTTTTPRFNHNIFLHKYDKILGNDKKEYLDLLIMLEQQNEMINKMHKLIDDINMDLNTLDEDIRKLEQKYETSHK